MAECTYLPLEIDSLNEFAKSLARSIFAWKPEWEIFGRMFQDSSSDAWEFYLKVPGRDDSLEFSLIVYTDQGEVTTNFSYWHEHLPSMAGEPYDFNAVRDQIERVITDHEFVVWAAGPNNHWKLDFVSALDEATLLDFVTDPTLSGNVKLVSFMGTKDDEFAIADVLKEGCAQFLVRRGRAS